MSQCSLSVALEKENQLTLHNASCSAGLQLPATGGAGVLIPDLCEDPLGPACAACGGFNGWFPAVFAELLFRRSTLLSVQGL